MDCSCGNKIDRDLNAAINIKNYAVSSTACVPINGAAISAGLLDGSISETMPVKQETNLYLALDNIS